MHQDDNNATGDFFGNAIPHPGFRSDPYISVDGGATVSSFSTENQRYLHLMANIMLPADVPHSHDGGHVPMGPDLGPDHGSHWVTLIVVGWSWACPRWSSLYDTSGDRVRLRLGRNFSHDLCIAHRRIETAGVDRVAFVCLGQASNGGKAWQHQYGDNRLRNFDDHHDKFFAGVNTF